MAAFHLAQINIARMLAPIDDPVMADFVAQLPPINGWRREVQVSFGGSNRIVAMPPASKSIMMIWSLSI
jgi:hypothetical protein